MENLSTTELKNLIRSVFSLTNKDKVLTIVIDVPDEIVSDHDAWKQRRVLASDWAKQLDDVKQDLNLDKVNLLYYRNVHNNNADLPEIAYTYNLSPENLVASTLLSDGAECNFENVLSQTDIALAPTQFSATAPMKLLAKKHCFRAATMPGFSPEMIPALRLDYEEINNRVHRIKELLDRAVALDINFETTAREKYSIHFDLRFRPAHASGGRFPESCVAGNLPSGECYIVPYEGEKEEKSESAGILPVQFEDEIVLYDISENVARKILSEGKYSEQEALKIQEEPAYANISELGFGVLKDFGVKPTGEILLDEKLGLHIAFGRSDHFGGNVGVKDFSSPDKVVHIDRIYIPETQNKIQVKKVELTFENEPDFVLIKDDNYTIF